MIVFADGLRILHDKMCFLRLGLEGLGLGLSAVVLTFWPWLPCNVCFFVNNNLFVMLHLFKCILGQLCEMHHYYHPSNFHRWWNLSVSSLFSYYFWRCLAAEFACCNLSAAEFEHTCHTYYIVWIMRTFINVRYLVIREACFWKQKH